MVSDNERQIIRQVKRELDSGKSAIAVKMEESGFVFGRDYDTVIDSTTGLVQTILLKLGAVLFKTITITYTDECRDQYTLVIT